MAHLSTHSIHNSEFARVLDMTRLRDRSDVPFDIAPTPGEAGALARLMGAQAVRKMRFKGALSPLSEAGWHLDAKLGASVVQTCVVTLDPVTTRIEQRVQRRFLPQDDPVSTEIVISPDDDDETEPLHAHIDLGLVAIEALALALPSYPRKNGATLAGGPGDTPEEPPNKPFASLAALRDKLEKGS